MLSLRRPTPTRASEPRAPPIRGPVAPVANSGGPGEEASHLALPLLTVSVEYGLIGMSRSAYARACLTRGISKSQLRLATRFLMPSAWFSCSFSMFVTSFAECEAAAEEAPTTK